MVRFESRSQFEVVVGIGGGRIVVLGITLEGHMLYLTPLHADDITASIVLCRSFFMDTQPASHSFIFNSMFLFFPGMCG